ARQVRQFGAGRRAAVTNETSLAIPSDDRDSARGVQLAESIVGAIADVNIAGAVDGHTRYSLKSGDSGDDARGINLADPIVILIRDIEVPDTVHCNAKWIMEFGFRG